VSTGATYENITNLAGVFIALIIERYEGTRLGAQELHAKYLEDVEGALWRLATIEAGRFLRFELSDPWHWLAAGLVSTNPAFGRGLNETFPLTHRRWRTVVSVDPPGETAECGITVGAAPIDGIAGRDHAVVLDDVSLVGAPEVWGPAAVAAYRTWDAEELVVEANQGGDMVRSTIHAADPTVNVTKIRAVDSKADRAEPISVLYSKGWIHHLGHLAKLEDQQTTWVPAEGKSPDRIDSVVHLLTHLLRPTTIAPASLPDQFDLARTRL
jgi:phage terminase large subunit-like protein